MSLLRICRLDELKAGSAKCFSVEGRDICVAHCDSGIYAIDDTCSHEDYSLAQGEIDADTCEIECWKHGSSFSLITGKPLTLPATQPVRTYVVVVADDEIAIELDS